jgi:hypothetical protein
MKIKDGYNNKEKRHMEDQVLEKIEGMMLNVASIDNEGNHVITVQTAMEIIKTIPDKITKKKKNNVSIVDEKEKQCIHCGAAESTAKLWKLKCTAPRHKFAYK